MTSEGTRSGFSQFFLNVLRIGAALCFMQHGVQKIFGVLGSPGAAEFPSKIWLAGALELWGGALILFGLFTRPVAFVLAGEMAVAYATSHMPNGFFPVVNRGELAILFMLIWLFLAANGGGAFSLDGLIASRRRGSTAG